MKSYARFARIVPAVLGLVAISQTHRTVPGTERQEEYRMKSWNWTLIAVCVLFWLSGCSKSVPEESPHLETQSSDAAGSPVSPDGSSSSKTPDYAEMFDTLVRGEPIEATDQQEEVSWKALERINQFNKPEHEEFILFLTPKLQDRDPYARIVAAFHIAGCRINGLGNGKENNDLIMTYVRLLEEDDSLVNSSTLIGMESLVRNSGLGEELKPLVQPLIRNLENPRTTYLSIQLLRDMGPLASEAVPYIRKAAERDNNKSIDKVSAEAIQKIEGSAQ